MVSIELFSSWRKLTWTSVVSEINSSTLFNYFHFFFGYIIGTSHVVPFNLWIWFFRCTRNSRMPSRLVLLFFFFGCSFDGFYKFWMFMYENFENVIQVNPLSLSLFYILISTLSFTFRNVVKEFVAFVPSLN